MLKKMGIPIQIGSQITLDFCDGNSETFTVTGILSGGETAKRFAVFFSKSYADSGSQLKDMPLRGLCQTVRRSSDGAGGVQGSNVPYRKRGRS